VKEHWNRRETRPQRWVLGAGAESVQCRS
jgi:hypothetical protein